jgi:hypothetical protein
MRKILYIAILLYFSTNSICQTNFLIKESGSATAQTVTYQQQMKFTKTSGSWNSAVFNNVQFYKVISDAIKNNSLTLNSSNVSVNNGVTLTETNSTDNFGNSKSLFKLTLPNPMSYNNFTLTLSYTFGTKLDITNVFNPSIVYPLSSSDIWNQKMLGYLDASTNIESTSPEIVNMAATIVSGATNLKSAVELLASWIAANITYTTSSTSALQVLRSKTGNCQGQSCLMIAFCRSLNIPARILCGDFFSYQMILPTDKNGSYRTIDSGTNGLSSNQTVGHALYEIYYPTIGWVRGDPAMSTLNFGWPTFIKNAGVLDPDVANKSTYTISTPANSNLVSNAQKTFSTSVSGFTSSFAYSSTKMLSGTKNNAKIFGVYDQSSATGFYDKVTIMDPVTGTTCFGVPVSNNTTIINPCIESSFYAKFETDYNPTTYANSFDWSIVLYHSGGEYTYAEQTGIMPNANTPNFWGESCVWKPTTSKLPTYNWAIDDNGNVYGLVKVLVHVSDGTTKYYETSIGVKCITNIQNVIYDSNSTIDTCTELKFTNVSVTGTPTITINGNSLGVTINGVFEAPLGSTLIINN